MSTGNACLLGLLYVAVGTGLLSTIRAVRRVISTKGLDAALIVAILCVLLLSNPGHFFQVPVMLHYVYCAGLAVFAFGNIPGLGHAVFLRISLGILAILFSLMVLASSSIPVSLLPPLVMIVPLGCAQIPLEWRAAREEVARTSQRRNAGETQGHPG